jgi:RNA polymerase-interacting CarD/CdnL/TRCF family regulator
VDSREPNGFALTLKHLTLNVGDKVYYRGRGPCLVGAIVHKVVCGASADFCSFTLLDDSGAELLVPLGNSSNLQFRGLIPRDEIPKLLSHLKTRGGSSKDLEKRRNWQQREVAKSKVFSSGSVFDLADLVESLTQSGHVRTLAMDERETLHRAKKLLICEIAEVMTESKSAAESRIDSVLMSGRNRTDKVPNTANAAVSGRVRTPSPRFLKVQIS